MKNELKKKYGLFMAIAMVVGIVIGSGVFFKAEKILTATGGNLPLGILSWLIGGIIMISCAYTFSVLATRYEYVNGLVDYADVMMGKKYGYYMGWFMTTIYCPVLAAILSWLTSRYLCVLLGYSPVGVECLVIAAFILIAVYALNSLAPILSGKLQISTTVIKLIPIVLMAIVGTIVGLANGMTVQNFTTIVNSVPTGTALFTAVCATAFAFDGWIMATTINAEIRDAKKNLPRALVFGTLIILVAYILYYIGLAGSVTNQTLMEKGEAGAKIAFSTLFSNVGGTVLFVFIVISCLGTLNGLMLASSRSMYALAARNVGPKPEVFREVSPKTNVPTNSSVISLLFCGVWLVYFYGSNLAQTPWFGNLKFDPSELPIITLYGAFIPMFISMMIKEKDLSVFKRFIMPSIAIIGCTFMVVAACLAHKINVLYYLGVFVIIMIIGAFFSKERSPEKE